jgi:ribosomal protein S27E
MTNTYRYNVHCDDCGAVWSRRENDRCPDCGQRAIVSDGGQPQLVSQDNAEGQTTVWEPGNKLTAWITTDKVAPLEDCR